MKDFSHIIDKYGQLDFSIRLAALATVVQVKGSSYRSPGARMLITNDGRWYGSISGGCLEGDALRKARQVMKEGVGMTVTYDTREGADPNLVINLGCNGIIDVLLEPISGAEISAIDQLIQQASGKEPAALASIFESDNLNGKKLMLSHSKGQLWTSGIDQLDELITFELQTALTSKKSYTKAYEINGQRINVFIEFLQPSISLAVFGAGIDARPVTQLAKNHGWNVSVTDECVAHIAPAFFPEADNLSLCQRDFVDRQLDITSNTACVLMSHNYDYDRDVLRKLLNTDAAYIGIMGPRKRFEKYWLNSEMKVSI